jgi:large subunit ribosomal protein L24
MKPQVKERLKMNIRKGDLVRVMAGKDKDAFKGRTSRVLSVDPVKGRVTVEHAHMIKRHTRPNPSKNIKGGIVEREAPIHISNVMLVCPGCNKPTRAGHKIDWETVKVTRRDGSVVEHKRRHVAGRICRKCGASLEK